MSTSTRAKAKETEAKETEAKAEETQAEETKATPTETDETSGGTTESAKRRIRTPEERVAHLERALAEARAQTENRAKRQVEQLTAQRDTLVGKRDELNDKIKSVESELAEAKKRAGQDDDDTSDSES